MTSGIYDEAFYSTEAQVSLRCARQIVPLIHDLFRPASVVDIGCGVGAFLRLFQDLGVKDVLGVDGDYVPRQQLLLPQQQFVPADLSAPFSVGRRFDLLLSLEVGEHLDESVADQFVRSLCLHSDLIVFSAAIPLQKGDHHVNERWQSYWVTKFLQCKYLPFDIIRPKIWANENVEVFYKQNILVFANSNAIVRFPDIMKVDQIQIDPKSYDLVHPDLYMMRAGPSQNLSDFIEQLADAGRPFQFRRLPDGRISADPV